MRPQVCQSYIYIIDEILLPTRNNTLASVPAVNTTFLQSLIGAGANAAPASGASGVGTITDPVYSSYSKASISVPNPPEPLISALHQMPLTLALSQTRNGLRISRGPSYSQIVQNP